MPDIFVGKDEPNDQPKKPAAPVSKSVPVQKSQSTSPPIAPESAAIDSVTRLINDKHRTLGLFTAYCTRPKGLTFVNQEPDEIALLFLRRHFITNVPWLLATLLLLLVPPVISLLPLLPGVSFGAFPEGLALVLTIFYYLIVGSYAFSKFISWFYNIGIVTQKRIVDIDSTNILAHDTATANFGEIVDVKFTQRGFFQSFFDYGNVHIQTEAIHANFEFDAAPKPTEVSDLISDLRVATKGGRYFGTP